MCQGLVRKWKPLELFQTEGICAGSWLLSSSIIGWPNRQDGTSVVARAGGTVPRDGFTRAITWSSKQWPGGTTEGGAGGGAGGAGATEETRLVLKTEKGRNSLAYPSSCPLPLCFCHWLPLATLAQKLVVREQENAILCCSEQSRGEVREWIWEPASRWLKNRRPHGPWCSQPSANMQRRETQSLKSLRGIVWVWSNFNKVLKGHTEFRGNKQRGERAVKNLSAQKSRH